MTPADLDALEQLEAALNGKESYALDDWENEIRSLLKAARQNERLKALLHRSVAVTKTNVHPNSINADELRRDIAKELT